MSERRQIDPRGGLPPFGPLYPPRRNLHPVCTWCGGDWFQNRGGTFYCSGCDR